MNKKSWFILVNGKNKGPLDLVELAQNSLEPDTLVWTQGMKNWEPASSIEAVASLFEAPTPVKTIPKNKPSKEIGELSALIEISPSASDDRTSAIDPAQLKYAKREAEKALRQRHGLSRRFNRLFGFFLIILAIGGGLRRFITASLGPEVQLSTQSWAALETQLKPILFALASTASETIIATLQAPFQLKIAAIPGVSKEDYSKLQVAARASLKTAGPQVELVLASENPIFYISTNLPDGAALNFHLFGEVGQILSERAVEIQVPVTVTKNLSQTPPLKLKTGNLPAGIYQVSLFDDETQPDPVKALLSSLPEISPKPGFLSGKIKLLVSRNLFIDGRGGKDGPQFRAQLNTLQANLKAKGSDEFQKLKQGTELAGSLLNDLLAAASHYSEARTPFVGKKNWNKFSKGWNLQSPTFSVLNEKGYFYLREFQLIGPLKDEIQALKDFLDQQIKTSIRGSTLNTQMEPKVASLQQKNLELRQKMESVEKLFLNPAYLPSLHE